MAHIIMNTLLLYIVVFYFVISEADQKITAMYVFGDSLVDVGNNNHLKLSIAKADFPYNGIDYPGKRPTGRFSNGKNYADLLAEKVGLKTSPPYLSLSFNRSSPALSQTGVSFASGGAGIFNGSDERFRQSLPLSKQAGYYSTVYEDLLQQLGLVAAENHLSKSLFIIVIGSNDIFDYFKSGSDLPQKNTQQQYIDSMLIALKQVLKRLHDFGGRKYVMNGIGAVGCCPSQRIENKTKECKIEANQMAVMYNKALQSMLQGLKVELNGRMEYSYIDVYRLFSSFIQKPSAYGFTEVKAACCGLGNLNARVPCTPVSSCCSNRSDHIFWDLYHPTEAAARILVDTIFDDSQYAVPMNIRQLIAA